tara:strand:+ start:1053 stop:1802 length:750 start_codon:yes stop_codon:yes gene_type:complete
MEKRPHPRKGLLVESGRGENLGSYFLQRVYGGLIETPLTEFYPWLDFDETIAFLAESWSMRDSSPSAFSGDPGSAAKLFNYVLNFQKGLEFLEKFSNIYNFWESYPDSVRDLHDKVNPFEGEDLKERLANVAPEHLEELHKKLNAPTHKYMTSLENEEDPMNLSKPDGRIVVSFPFVYPSGKKMAEGYASKIAEIFRKNYPQEYFLLEGEVEEKLIKIEKKPVKIREALSLKERQHSPKTGEMYTLDLS